MNTKSAGKAAMSLEGVTTKDHFGSDAFYANKRIFATVWHEKNTVNLRLDPEKQEHFLGVDGDAFAPVDNAFGKQGWTTVFLDYVDDGDFKAAVKAAHELSASARAREASRNARPKKKAVPRKRPAPR